MAKLDTLEDGFREKVVQLLINAEAVTGVKWCVTCGRRTIEEQDALYAQGRKKPGPVVTKAPGGSSAHNFGLAADLCPLKDGKAWWEAPRSVWQQMADEAIKLELTAGYYFKTIFDAPHVEDPSWKQRQALWRQGMIHVA